MKGRYTWAEIIGGLMLFAMWYGMAKYLTSPKPKIVAFDNFITPYLPLLLLIFISFVALVIYFGNRRIKKSQESASSVSKDDST